MSLKWMRDVPGEGEQEPWSVQIGSEMVGHETPLGSTSG